MTKKTMKKISKDIYEVNDVFPNNVAEKIYSKFHKHSSKSWELIDQKKPTHYSTIFKNNSKFLPDENDIHVLQAAIEGNADELLTANLKDFPTSILSSHGIIRRSPDDFLLEIAMSHRNEILKIIETVKKEAIRRSGISINNRKMLKSSRLPKLAKFIAS